MTATAYDVFISHAFEDKNTFTNALALTLKEKGLKVWYSGFELKMGDSITSSVNNALKNAKYAVVVISPVYLGKTWAMNELQALFAGEAKHKRILPILHQISVDEIKTHLPVLADRYAISSDQKLEVIVGKILEVVTGEVNKDQQESVLESRKKKSEKEQDGYITLGRADEEKKAANYNTNVNTNTNHITVHTGNSSNGMAKAIVIGVILVALLVCGYFIKIYYNNPKVKPDRIENGSPAIPGERVR